jgi:hypothetical protein
MRCESMPQCFSALKNCRRSRRGRRSVLVLRVPQSLYVKSNNRSRRDFAQEPRDAVHRGRGAWHVMITTRGYKVSEGNVIIIS